MNSLIPEEKSLTSEEDYQQRLNDTRLIDIVESGSIDTDIILKYKVLLIKMLMDVYKQHNVLSDELAETVKKTSFRDLIYFFLEPGNMTEEIYNTLLKFKKVYIKRQVDMYHHPDRYNLSPFGYGEVDDIDINDIDLNEREYDNDLEPEEYGDSDLEEEEEY